MDDLECMACPPKYRHIADFWKYYSGQVTAPYPTIFSERPCPACCCAWSVCTTAGQLLVLGITMPSSCSAGCQDHMHDEAVCL
jgi:hypothetical protein